jgi:Uma2 family endonuclease
MKLARSGREPDVLYVANEHLARLKQAYLDGPADLVVAIVSPESAERDRSSKFYEYQEAGILEYWPVDPDLQQARFYLLDTAGRYQLVAPDDSSIYRSRVLPDFWLRVACLWQESLPDTTRILLEIVPDAYAHYLREQLRQADL